MANASGEALDNILDYRGVHESILEFHITPLTDSQIREVFGTSRPARGGEFERNLVEVYGTLDRAHAVCFPLYETGDADSPTNMMFVGYTAD